MTNSHYTPVKGEGYFRARHDSLTDQASYVDGMTNALPLKGTSTNF